MPADYYCDKCGKQADGMDYDGAVLCEYHDAEKQLMQLRDKYKSKLEWLKNTHLKGLAELRDEIKKYEALVER